MASLAAPLGLLFAWGGLFLPWRHWSAQAGDGSSSGFHESTPFWIALAVVTVLVLVVWREQAWRWARWALAAATLALTAIALRQIAGYLVESSEFVTVGPGIGALLSLLGALLLVGAALAALPRPALRWALAAVVVVAAWAILWPAPDGRPGAGAIAEFTDAHTRALAFHDGTLYGANEVYLTAIPRAGRDYEAFTVHDTDWFDSIADGFADDIAFAGDELYAKLGSLEQVGTLAPDGKAGTTAKGTRALALAPAGDNGIYLLTPDGVSVLSDDRVTAVAEMDLDEPRDIASDGKGGAYVADTGNGRVLHMDADGRVKTVVGTEAAPGCVSDGKDDPLTLDTGACTGVHALAADDDGNLYLALRAVGMVVGLTPEGRMSVVAGTGPSGWTDGGDHAVQAHLGQVNGLEVGPDDDLYIDEDNPIDRVRRVADPASLLDDPRPKPAAPVTSGVCGAIARVREAAVRSSGPVQLDDAIAALDRATPDDLRPRVDDLVDDYRRHRENGDPLTQVIWFHNGYRATVADYAEDECGLVAGYSLSAADTNRFCLAYVRYTDTHELLPKPTEEPPPEWAAVKDTAPPMLEFANPAVVDDFASSVCVNN